MVKPDNFTFFVYNKSIEKWWACSREALNVVKELREELEGFALHECSVQEGIDRFVEDGGKLELNGYRLEADKIFYKDSEAKWGMKNIRFVDYIKALERLS